MGLPQYEPAFIKAYDAYADAIFRHCYFRVYNRELGKELMQETFTRTWDYMVKGNEVKNIRTFLYKIANNLIIDHVRKKKELSLETLQETGFEPSHTTKDDVHTHIDAERVIEVIEKLDEMYREPVLMRYLDGLKPKEIAELLNETVNVVSVRINRGVKQLRELLK